MDQNNSEYGHFSRSEIRYLQEFSEKSQITNKIDYQPWQ